MSGPPRTVASLMKSQVQTWPRRPALVGSPVETPRRMTLRLVGGTRSPLARRSRWMCFFPTLQPSSRRSRVIRR